MATAKNRLPLNRWRSWEKRGNIGFRMSLATGVFSALSCRPDCLLDQKKTIINIRFTQLWLVPNQWHFNVLQEIASNTHTHMHPYKHTFFPICRHSETRCKSECQWKSFTHAVTQRSTHSQTPGALYWEKWQSLIDRYFKLLLSWRILASGLLPHPTYALEKWE